jgi:hypothetical protein
MFLLLADAKGQIPSGKLQKGKWLQSWLVCGPFPNTLAEGVTEYRHDKTKVAKKFPGNCIMQPMTILI